MRRQKDVVLEGMPVIVMREMTPSHLPRVLKLLSDLYASGATSMDARHLVNVILSNYDDLNGIIQGCSSLTPESFSEIGGYDLVECIEAWVEANSPFFERVTSRLSGLGASAQESS